MSEKQDRIFSKEKADQMLDDIMATGPIIEQGFDDLLYPETSFAWVEFIAGLAIGSAITTIIHVIDIAMSL